MKEDFIKALLSNSDYNLVLDSLPNCYAKGYLTAKLNNLTDSIDSTTFHVFLINPIYLNHSKYVT